MTGKDKTMILLIAGGILILLLALFIGTALLNKKTSNPEGTVGNTAGNLYDSGYFCEQGGRVYFANAKEGGVLYSMNPDESDVKRLSNAIAVNLLADENFLYYFQLGTSGGGNFENVVSNRSFMRSNHNGQKIKTLAKEIVVSAQLVNNSLYYLTSGSKQIRFYKSDLEHNNIVDLADYVIQPSCVYDSQIIYAGTLDDHCLYSLNTESDVQTKVMDANLCFPVFYEDFLYYLNVEKNYRLERYSFSSGRNEVLTNDRVDCYNIGSGYIYYQKNGTSPQLICMRCDGSGAMVLAEGNYTKINMTSAYVYFQEFGVPNVTFHSPIGSSSFSVFSVE